MKKRSKKRITLSAVAESSGKKINGQEFLDTARKRPQDFTRNRKMPFGRLGAWDKSLNARILSEIFDRRGSFPKE